MIENERDWVITTLGKVVRRDKAKPKDEIKELIGSEENGTTVIIPNSFPTKEDAIFVRDKIIEERPNAFLQVEEPKKKPGPKPRGKVVEQDEFRDMMRANLMERIDTFWLAWEKLSPSDKCTVYAKLLLFAYSKAPNEKVVDPADVIKRKADAKRQAAAERIAQGLNSIEDTDFEE